MLNHAAHIIYYNTTIDCRFTVQRAKQYEDATFGNNHFPNNLLISRMFNKYSAIFLI